MKLELALIIYIIFLLKKDRSCIVTNLNISLKWDINWGMGKACRLGSDLPGGC